MRAIRTQLLSAVLAAAALVVLPLQASAEAVLSHAAKAAAKEKTASGHFSTLGESNVKESLILAAEKRWGHDDMHARYYSPYLARFLSVDPVGGEVGSSQSWNRYSYVLNNPLNMVDPTGEAGKEIADAISNAVVDAVDWYADNVNDDSAVGGAVNDAAVVAGALVDGVGDLLRVGDSTGTAIAEGQSGGDLAVAVSQDVGRASGLVLMMAGPAQSALRSTGAAAETSASSPVGSARSPMNVVEGTNAPGQVMGRPYTGHAFDRMQGRGLTPTVVEDTVQTGASAAGNRAGTLTHFSETNNVTVVTDAASGRVITVRRGSP